MTRQWLGLKHAGVSVFGYADTHSDELGLRLDSVDLRRALTAEGRWSDVREARCRA